MAVLDEKLAILRSDSVRMNVNTFYFSEVD
jgi:hypothetical protein